jgi:hypothetical protein
LCAGTPKPETDFYNPANDPNAVFSGGTYARSDPDPNIRAALIREFGRRMFLKRSASRGFWSDFRFGASEPPLDQRMWDGALPDRS